MADYRVVQEPWGGWYTVTPDGRWIGPYPSEDQARNIVEGTIGTPERPPTGKPVAGPSMPGPIQTMPGPITPIPWNPPPYMPGLPYYNPSPVGPNIATPVTGAGKPVLGPSSPITGTSMPGTGTIMNSTSGTMPGATNNMDANNYVAPDGNGGWIVVVNGQPIPGSPFGSQQEAENAYNSAGGSAPVQQPQTQPTGTPTAPTATNPFDVPTGIENVTPPDKSARSQVIAWIWNNFPDIRNNYAMGGWNVQDWNGVVSAIENWLAYPVNSKYNGDPFAAAMDMGLDESHAWLKDEEGNYILTSVDDMKANYGTELPWERDNPDLERYWVREGLVTDPAGKQRYQWRNSVTGEYRWTEEDKSPSQLIPSIQGAVEQQQSWNFSDVLRGIGLDANNLNWNVSSEWMPSDEAKAMFKDQRYLPAALEILTGGQRDDTMNRTVAAGYLQGSQLAQDMMSEAQRRGVGANVGDSGFQFVAGRHLPARQVMNALYKEGEEGSTAKALSGMAEYSGQNASEFWTDFKSHLPTGQGNPLTRYI